VWLRQNDLGKVEAWLGASAPDPSQTTHFKTKLTYTMHARALIALSRAQPGGTHLADALRLLEGLLALAESNGWGNKVIEILVLQSLALEEAGDTARAMAALERALSLGEPEGFVRTFVDEGDPMARLLYEALARGSAGHERVADYARRLLAAFPLTRIESAARSESAAQAEPAANAEQAAPANTQASPSDLIEPLSDREREVLGLIADGLTNPEIAARLYLSLNTVKAHTRNIYGKLDVHSRTQAVGRARALGLLSSS
jgi:LuxR family maltose regulon positive regulatory protein